MQVTVAVDVSKLNVRWEEPYVSQGLNRKALALPSGAYRGLWFFTKNDANLYLSVDPDSLDMDKQHFGVIEDRTNGFAISFRDTGSLTIDCSTLLTGGAAQTFYVWIEADYTVSSATTGTIVVSNVIGDIPSDGYIFLGLIDVDAGATTLLEGTNCTYDYDDSTNPRMTPQPTKVDAYSNYSARDKQFGFIGGQERRNLPINNEKDAMTASTSPSLSNPFVTHSCQIPLVVDVRTYGALANYDAITGYGKGAGKGIVGISQTGIGGNFTGGNAAASSNNNGGPGAFSQGGLGDGTGDGGIGGNFVGGVGGDTGTGGVGVYSTGGNGGSGGAAGGAGVHGQGGAGIGGTQSGGDGVYGYGGAGAGLGSAGFGVRGVGRLSSAGVKGEGGTGTAPGVRGVGGDTNGLGGSFTGGGSNSTGVLGTGVGTGVGIHGTGDGVTVAIPSEAQKSGVFGRGAAAGATETGNEGGYFLGSDGGATSGAGGNGAEGQGGAATDGGGGDGLRGLGGDAGTSGGGGDGVYGYGGDGAGLGAAGYGVHGVGREGAAGVRGEGGTGSAPGVSGTGGDTNGFGGYFTGGTSNGTGVQAQGDGTGKGVIGLGTGASSSLPTGSDGAGVAGVGSTADGPGVVGLGGVSDGHGGLFVGDGQGYGILALGTGATDPGGSLVYGAGLVAMGSPGDVAPGVYAQGGASSGASLGGYGTYSVGGNSSGGDGGKGVHGQGGNGGGTANDGGAGVYGAGGARSDSSGYDGPGGQFDATLNRGHLFLYPLASLPTGGKQGDLCVRNVLGTPKLYICTVTGPGGGSPPTWVVVGTQT